MNSKERERIVNADRGDCHIPQSVKEMVQDYLVPARFWPHCEHREGFV